MQINRRKFMKTTAAVSAVSLSSMLGYPAMAQDSGTLKVAYSARGLKTIDPVKITQGVDGSAIMHIHDKLVDLPRWRFPKTMDEVVPRLASSWSSTPDSKNWTFKLRTGVSFQKGYGEFTAEDVKATFDRARDADRIGGVKPKFKNISEIVVEDSHTVTFKLTLTDPLFLLSVLSDTDGCVMSAKAIAEKGDDGISMDPIGTGPYQMETIHQDPSQGVTVVAFADHWDVAPATERIQFMYMADTTARTLAIISGDVHMMDGVRAPGWADSIKAKAPELLFDVVSPGSFFTLHFNLTVKPFDDIRVRQAFCYAIDRNEITTAIAPISKRSYGLNPPSFPGGFTKDTIPDEVAYNYNPEKAKSLLAEAGFPNGFSFKTNTSQRQDYASIALMVQDHLRRIDVDMDLNIMDHSAFHASQNAGGNTLSLHSSALPPVPTYGFSRYLSAEAEVKAVGGGRNFSHYGVAMPGIDDLLQQALAEPNLDKRLQLVQEMDLQVMRDAALLHLSTNGFMIVRSPKVDLGFEVESGFTNWPYTQAKIIG